MAPQQSPPSGHQTSLSQQTPLGHQAPLSGGKVVLLTGGFVMLVLAVIAAAGLLVRTAEPADSPAAAAPVESLTVSPTAPGVTPSRNPRRQPDIDRGTPISFGIYVEIAEGWDRETAYGSMMRATSFGRGASLTISLSRHPLPGGPLLRPDAEGFAGSDQIDGVKLGAVRSLPPPNLNIVEAASISFTGRRTVDDITYSLSGECVRLRGAPAVNDVSASICWAAYVQDLDTVRPEARQMIASLARSI
jgi:hypothetical protein